MQRKGMVDALHEARRVLRPGGIIVDSRPDSRVLAKVEHGKRVVGVIRTQSAEFTNDAASDRALVYVKRERLLRRLRAGRFWHRIPFPSLAALEDYLRDHLRFEHRVRWTAVGHRGRALRREDPFVIVRAIRFELLERAF